ncbi:MAG: hypothetical protein K9K38_07885 [Rhodoferax sp.]|nr:hypothetical protein [Rhodoferax sp.]
MTFTITRDGDTSVAGSVDWLVELPGGSTSSAANDFVAGQDALSRNNGLPSGNVSFSAGQASQTLTVNIATDGKVERDETFRVVLQNGGSNVDVAPGVATATVTNDDTGFSVEAVDTSKSEGQSGTTTYSFSVTRAGAISQAATVAWALTGSGSNPVNAADFGGSLPSGTVSFAANELSKTLEISVAGDTSVEFDEGFTVTISNARLADTSLQTIVDASATGLIRNDDQSFVVSAANALITEGNSGNRTVLFDVTRTGVLAGAVSVAYSVTGGTGTDAADLASSPLPSGTLNFADGIAQQQISFDVRGDTLAEGDEVYTLSLSNPSAGTLATASGTASIVNDDTNFVLVAPSNTSEGTSGTTAVQFTVTRTGVTTGTGSVNWKLVGTAAGLSTADFVGNQDTLSNNGGMPSGTVSFLANQTSKTITLNVQGDTGVENDETLQILLSSPIGGVIEGTDGDKSALLLTDDDAFSLSPAAESRAEGHSDNTMSYTVLRTGSLTGARNLTWTVTGANGFATGTDLATGQAASGTVSFAEGQTSATISITLKGDTVVETDETMTMTLSAAPANSTITTAATSTNITNDDASFAIAPLVASAVEGNSGYVDLTYKVTRSGFLNQSNTVTWSMDATANPSVNSSDFYFSQPSGYRDASNLPYGSLVFYTGETEKTITLRMAGDSNYEPNEIPRVALSVPSTGSIVGTATADGTLTNDDAEFNITASPAASFFEGDGGTSGVVMTYTITRTGNLNQANTVNWSVGGSGANYANYLDFIDPTTLTFYKYYNIYGSYSDSGGRYDRKTPDGTVSFAANESSKTISFRISGDTGGGSVEPDEGFTLSLNTPSSGSSLGANMQTSHTILNDDTRMTLSVDDYSKAESVTGTNTTYNYTITRSGYLGHSTGYSWSVGGVGNTVLDYTQSSRAEYSAGTDDFASNTYPSGSGSFAANDTTKTFSITALGDDTPEDDQWFSANLSGTSGSDEIYVIYDNPSSYTNSTLFGLQYANDVRDSVAASGSSLYTSIERDEAVFELYSQEVYSESQYASGMSSRAEGDTVSDGGSNSSNDLVEHIFRIDRTIAQSGTASVGWYVEAIPRTQAEIDSNTVRNDYANAADFAGNSNPLNYSVALASGTVNFADGQRYGYIKFYSQADNVGELDEFYRVNLTSASAGSSISTDKSQATPMLANDDTRFTFAASTGNLTEGSSATYTVTRVGDTRGSDTVDWSLALSNEVSNEGNTNSATWYRLDASDIETPVTSSGTPSLNGSTWSGTLTFADGVSTQTVVVKTVDDSYSETWREDFTFNFSNPQNPHLSETRDDQETPTTIGQTLRFDKTVYDNDPDPLITVSSNLTSVIEGSSSTSHQVPFTITRTDQSGRDGTLQYSTTVALSYYYNGGGVAYTASTVTFGAGETTKQVTATVSGSDYVDTSSRYVSVTALSASSALALQVPSDGYGPANVGSPSSASVQLTDDDIQLWVNSFGVVNPFVASPATINAYEGTPLTFNVVRRGLSSTPVTVSYTLTTGTAGSSDVTGVTSGSFTIPSMSLSYALTLPQELVDDTTVEGLENFVLTLTAPTDVSGTTVRFLAKSDDLSTTPTSSQAFTVNLYDNDNTYTVSAPGSTNESTPGYSSTAFNFGVTRTSTGYSGSTNLSNIKWKVESVGANGVTSADFSTSDALGTNGGLPSGTLNGIYSTGTITVNVRGDSTVEPDEQFRVVLFEETLTTPTPDLVKSLNVASGSATIANDDTGISIADATVTETDADQTITFTVTRNGVLTRTSSVNWIASGISAAFDSDFAGTTSGTLSFASGETTKTITLTVKGDVSPEATETFTVGLSTLNNIEDPIDISAIGTIRNDDNSFAVSAGTPSLEGSAQVFTVTRVRDTVQDQTITWAVSLPTGSTATAADFNNSLPSGSVTFAPGELSKTFNVTAFDDTANETEETYSVGISLGTGTTGDVITTATASGSLRDNDALFSITANAAAKLEGNSASTAFTFAVDSISGTGSVEWRLSSTTATASDFSTPDSLGNNGGLPSGTLVFSGTATQTLTIAVVGDTTVEQDEPFTVTLSNPAGGLVVSPTTASSTITTDESSVVLSALNAVRAEGNSGSTPFTFKVTRTGAIGDATTVAYAVTGSGTNPANAADFGSSLPSGSLSLPANQAETTLTINVNGDLLGEADEEFTVTLSNPAAGLTIAGATASGTLQTDDVVFDVQAPATRAEGNAGATTLFDFVVTRSGNLTGAQTLNWSVAGTGADPTDSSDFDAVSGSVEFAANDTSKTISVPVKGDLLGEAHEGFRLSLTGPSGVVFTHAFADAVITDDEASLRVAATDSNKLEGASGTTTHTFTVTRSGNTAVATSVDWAVQAGNGLDASDFAGGVLPSGTLQFASEVNTATISVQVAGDTVVEANETLSVSLSNPGPAAVIVAGSANGSIVSEDMAWTVTAIDAAEGDSTINTKFRIERSGGVLPTSIDWSVSASGTDAASASDFFGAVFASGNLSFAQGVSSQEVSLAVAGDSVREGDETYLVTLTAPTDSHTHSYTRQSHTGTLQNDDDVMSVAALAAENAENGANPSFTVTRSGSLTGTSSVGWQISHGSTLADDFTATSGIVNFADGQSSAVLTLSVAGERTVETDETFSVQLTHPGSGSSLDPAASSASGILRNDDVDLSVAAGTGVEGDDGAPGQASFTVTRSGDLSGSTSVDWRVQAGTALAADFANAVLPSGTLSFASGESSKNILVALAGDGVQESNETFTLQLSNASSHADLVSTTANGSIQDDDDTLTVVAQAGELGEGDSGSTAFTYRIDRSGSSIGTASVTWNISGAGAHATTAADFEASSGTVTLADGESSKTFSVQVKGEQIGEYDEGFALALTNPSFGSVAAATTASGTIRNDDPVLLLRASQTSGSEGADGAETPFTFTVVRSGNITLQSSVQWQVVRSGTRPVNAMDFGGELPSGELVFGAGVNQQQLVVNVLGDAVGEFDKTFSLVLSTPVDATILEGSIENTIRDDDTGVSLVAVDADKLEGNTGVNTNFSFRVERMGALDAATIQWQTQGSGSYPVNADDFVGGAFPSGTINFAQNEVSRDIVLQVAGDNAPGQNQSFKVVLTGNYLINREVSATIRNDDSLISVSAQTPTLAEGNAGESAFSFVVSRTGATDLAASVDWRVAGSGGHQANAADFVGNVLPSGSVQFNAGEASKTVTVRVAGDTLTEVDEAFSVQLVNPGSGVSIDQNTAAASATIQSDDQGVVLIGLDVERKEGTAGTQTAMNYQVFRSGNISADITLNYTVSGRVDSNDFVSPLTGSFTMAAGVSSHLLSLNVRGDATLESDETFQVALSGAGINFDSAAVSGVIKADEEGFSVAARQTTVSEGTGSGARQVIFDITASGITSASTVNWSLVSTGQNAVTADDFVSQTLPSGSHVFNSNATQTVTLELTQDASVEFDEAITLGLDTTSALPLLVERATSTLANDDLVGAGDDRVEGNAGSDTQLSGQQGNDSLFGYGSGDVLDGGEGNDVLHGGSGADILIGGSGADRFVFQAPGEGVDILKDFEPGVDQIGYASGQFGTVGATLSSVAQAFDTNVATTLAQLAARADAEVYKVSFAAGNFAFATGAQGQLDELEATMTQGNHTGSAFFLISDGATSRLYFDADTNLGSDGSGLVALAELPTISSAHTTPDLLVQHAS